jgi:hypothetical protein
VCSSDLNKCSLENFSHGYRLLFLSSNVKAEDK